MITTDLRAPLNLAAAPEHVPRQPNTLAANARSVTAASLNAPPISAAGILLRIFGTVQRPASSHAKGRRRPPRPGYAPPSAQKPPPSSRKPPPSSQKPPPVQVPPPSSQTPPPPSSQNPPPPAAQRPPAHGAAAPGASARKPAVKPSAQQTSAQKPSPGKPSTGDPLAFLHDPTLSIEDKLIRLLAYLSARWDAEVQEKMDRIAASEGAKKSSEGKSSGSSSSSGSSGSKKKSGGLFGSLGGLGDLLEAAISPAAAALKIPGFTDLLKQVSGPVLAAGATAIGLPEAAPFLLKNGPAIVDTASKLVSSLDGAGEGGSGSGSGSSGGGSKPPAGGTKALSDSEMQMLFMEIQRIQQKQQEMFGLVSSILKSNHDTRMAVVNNIR